MQPTFAERKQKVYDFLVKNGTSDVLSILRHIRKRKEYTRMLLRSMLLDGAIVRNEENKNYFSPVLDFKGSFSNYDTFYKQRKKEKKFRLQEKEAYKKLKKEAKENLQTNDNVDVPLQTLKRPLTLRELHNTEMDSIWNNAIRAVKEN